MVPEWVLIFFFLSSLIAQVRGSFPRDSFQHVLLGLLQGSLVSPTLPMHFLAKDNSTTFFLFKLGRMAPALFTFLLL